MNELIASLVKIGAPLLGNLIGGPVGGIATKVITEMAGALNVPATPDAINKEILNNPDAANILKELESNRSAAYLQELNAHIENTKDARATTVTLAKEGSNIAWGAPVISVLVVILFSVVLLTFVTKPINLNDIQSAILNILLGTLTMSFAQVVNYWLGSSHGSASKDAMLKSMATTNSK